MWIKSPYDFVTFLKNEYWYLDGAGLYFFFFGEKCWIILTVALLGKQLIYPCSMVHAHQTKYTCYYYENTSFLMVPYCYQVTDRSERLH